MSKRSALTEKTKTQITINTDTKTELFWETEKMKETKNKPLLF